MPLTPEKKAIYGKIAAESGGFAFAEGASILISLGVVGVADQLFPNQMKDASKVVSKLCIEPYLDTIEKSLGKICKLEECQPDKNKSREERAQELAKTMITFSAAWALSMVGKVFARRLFNEHIIGIETHREAGKFLSAHERRIFVADEGIHYGSILLMNTIGAPVTDDMIKSMSGILTKCGMPEKKAREVSSMAVIWELPNFLGMLSGIGAIAHDQLKGASHVEKLMASREAAKMADPTLHKP